MSHLLRRRKLIAGQRQAQHFDPQHISIRLQSKSCVFLASKQFTLPRGDVHE